MTALPLLTGLLVLVCLGCSDPEEFAYFEARRSMELPECVSEAFPMELTHLAAQNRAGTLGLFFQTPPDIKARSDVLYIELEAPEDIQRDEVVEIGPRAPHGRGKLTFFSSCPYQGRAFDLAGSLRFDSFDFNQVLGVISGELLEGVALDSRSGETAFEELTGTWRFVVRRGPPYEDFFALPERPIPGDL